MTESANEAIVRSGYEAHAEGDLARMLQFVDPDLEWTYLDPADEDPQPQVCHGRHELETALNGLLTSGLRSYIEEVCTLRATESWRWYVHQGSTDMGVQGRRPQLQRLNSAG